MSGKADQNPGNPYTSKLTRSLVEKADSLLDGGDLSNQSIDEQFAALGDDAMTALNTGDGQLKDLAKLASLISQSGGKEVGLDGAFELAVSEDKMFMSVAITPPLGRANPVTVKDIVDELRSRGIQNGVMIEEIKKAVDQAGRSEEVNDRVIARGRLPVTASEPDLVFFGRKAEGEIEEISEQWLLKGSRAPVLCQEADTIAYVKHSDRGRDGYTVTGEILPAPPPKPVSLECGGNVTVSGDHYKALISGVVILKDNRIEVQKALIFNKDVGRSDSPVTFAGSIHIHGGVHNGVEIEATEDIVIDRLVEGATIRSIHGDVVLQAGIAGRNVGQVRAGKDLIGGFVENASIIAGRDIKLQVGSLNSQLTANNDILAEAGKGSLAGGILIAGNSIHAKNIGSCGTKTTIITGVGPSLLPQLSDISDTVAAHQIRLKETLELIAQFERAVRDPSKLTGQELIAYTNLQKLRVITEHQIGELETRRNKVLEESIACIHGDVKIYQNLGPEVFFHVGPMKYTHRESRGPLTITYDPAHSRIVCQCR